MIEFKLFKTAVRLDFSFFAVLFIFMYFDNGGGLEAVSACVMHELSHLVAMLICDVTVTGVMFYGAGVRITADLCSVRRWVRIAVLSAGVAANFALAAIFYATGEYTLSAVNLVTGAFNLLPVGEFDGAQLFREFLTVTSPPDRIEGIMRVAAWVSLALCAAALCLFSGSVGITLVVTAIYLLVLMCRSI